MVKHSKHSMKGAIMPSNHFERHEKGVSPVCGLKYSGEFSNAEDLDKMQEGLASYVRKNQMKY
jgi:hypothetical protein